MSQHTEKLRAYLEQNPIAYTDGDSLLEQLYWCYVEANAFDATLIREQYQNLYRSMPELPEEKFEEIFEKICGFSIQQEKVAFQTGAKIGFRLAMELLG